MFTFLVGFHLIAAKYCNRIHFCAKPLMKASTEVAAGAFRNGGTRGQQTISTRYATQLALYVEKYHTEHEYGMTYFDLGLISLKTFVKVRKLNVFKIYVIFYLFLNLVYVSLL